jgi:flagellum-specific ATP synthase
MNMTSSVDHQKSALAMRDLVATWRENEELIRLGAYRRGTDPKVDRSIMLKEEIDGFLRQTVEENTPFDETVERLIKIAERPDPIRRPPLQR